MLATSDGMIMSPTQLAKLGANFGSDPVCVGPFTFDHRDAGVDVTVVKSPYYYAPGAVHLDKIVFEDEAGGAPALAALEAGDIQVIDSIPSSEVAAIRQNHGLSLIHRNALGYDAVMINVGNRSGVGNLPYQNVGSPLAASPKLRQAFEEAIDRDTLVKVASGGESEAGCTPLAPRSPYYTDVPCTPYDPADARKLVAASGIPSPTVHLLASGGSVPAQFIQAEEAAVGINVVIDSESATTQLADWMTGSFDAAIRSNPNGTVPDRIVYGPLASSGSLNYSGYSNPRLDLILANSRKATLPRGAADAVPGRGADRPCRPSDDLPGPPAHRHGLQLRGGGCRAELRLAAARCVRAAQIERRGFP